MIWIPAFAGMTALKNWIPAFAGMTANGKMLDSRLRGNDGEGRTANGEGRTANGERRTANGERRTANGERRTANGKMLDFRLTWNDCLKYLDPRLRGDDGERRKTKVWIPAFAGMTA